MTFCLLVVGEQCRVSVLLCSSAEAISPPDNAGLAEQRGCSLFEMLAELKSLLEYIGLRHKTKQTLIGAPLICPPQEREVSRTHQKLASHPQTLFHCQACNLVGMLQGSCHSCLCVPAIAWCLPCCWFLNLSKDPDEPRLYFNCCCPWQGLISAGLSRQTAEGKSALNHVKGQCILLTKET